MNRRACLRDVTITNLYMAEWAGLAVRAAFNYFPFWIFPPSQQLQWSSHGVSVQSLSLYSIFSLGCSCQFLALALSYDLKWFILWGFWKILLTNCKHFSIFCFLSWIFLFTQAPRLGSVRPRLMRLSSRTVTCCPVTTHILTTVLSTAGKPPKETLIKNSTPLVKRRLIWAKSGFLFYHQPPKKPSGGAKQALNFLPFWNFKNWRADCKRQNQVYAV